MLGGRDEQPEPALGEAETEEGVVVVRLDLDHLTEALGSVGIATRVELGPGQSLAQARRRRLCGHRVTEDLCRRRGVAGLEEVEPPPVPGIDVTLGKGCAEVVLHPSTVRCARVVDEPGVGRCGPKRGPLSLGPFPGVRYAPEVPLERVLAPPYDVVERDEALALARADEHNVVRLVLPEGVDPAAAAAATLAGWLDQGVLRVDDEAGLYVYEQADATVRRGQRGLIGALALTGPDSRAVLPHEDVMPGPVEDRTRLMAATAANLEPIWLLYRGARERRPPSSRRWPQGLRRWPRRSTADGTRHRLWAVTDAETLAAVAADLAGRQALIADGHHRHAAYRRVQAEHRAAGDGAGPWDRGLALLVDLEHPPAGPRGDPPPRRWAAPSDAVRAHPVDGVALDGDARPTAVAGRPGRRTAGAARARRSGGRGVAFCG